MALSPTINGYQFANNDLGNLALMTTPDVKKAYFTPQANGLGGMEYDISSLSGKRIVTVVCYDSNNNDIGDSSTEIADVYCDDALFERNMIRNFIALGGNALSYATVAQFRFYSASIILQLQSAPVSVKCAVVYFD